MPNLSKPPRVSQRRNLLKDFIAREASGGIVLLAAAMMALLLENSALQPDFHHLLDAHIIGKSLHFWINDGLMALFFLLVGLEIKRERLEGHLASRQQCLLPAIAACGGVAAPALIFALCNAGNATALHGWAIPTATDIAFALCVIQLLGKRIPQGLKVTLVTIAIIDDLMAISIIALFYTQTLNLWMLTAGGCITVALWMLNQKNHRTLSPYLLLGAVLWVCVWQSGIHATIAGVVTALCIPPLPAKRLEHTLHPYSAYLIMPLFALANAGLSLRGLTLADLTENTVTLGIVLGLLLGKPIGVMLASALSIRAGWCKLPQHCGWSQFGGMAMLCGIGFTMSLFIGGLSYADTAHQEAVRLGVLTGSVLSALLGYGWLRKN